MIPSANNRFSDETPVTYLYASEHVELLDHRNRRLKLNRVSLRADILKERHETGQLGELSPWRRFQDADVFLYLRSALAPDEFSLYHVWQPWSAALRASCPGFLLEATQQEKAKQLIAALGVRNIPELRSRLKERVGGGSHPFFGQHNPFYDGVFEGLRPDLIGTK